MAPSETRILPRALKKGDLIALVSPSARLNLIFPERFARGKECLEQMGYRTKVIFDSSEPKNHRDLVLKRCEEVHAAFRDPEVNAIVCAIGGDFANELLPNLDYELIKKNPKIFCGYSDISLLHHGIFTKTGLQTFYGPTIVPEFGEFPKCLDLTTSHFQHILHDSVGKPAGPLPRSTEFTSEWLGWEVEKDTVRARQLSPSPAWEWIRPGKATGRIFGGCIPSVVRLSGSKYWPDYTGRILMLEDPAGQQMTDPYPMDRLRTFLADLANTGTFEKISGLVVGRPYLYNKELGKEWIQTILDECYGTEFPILFNIDIGHTAPILTIPLNAMVSLDSDKDEFSIVEEVVLP